jgi:hypothetical protein
VKKKSKKLKMVGIVGPYFGDGNYNTIEENICRVEKFAIALANRGIPFFCAHLHTRHFEVKAKAPEDFYKKQDMHILLSICSALLAVPGWETSDGARIETMTFQQLGRLVFFPKSPDDLDEVEKWAQEE